MGFLIFLLLFSAQAQSPEVRDISAPVAEVESKPLENPTVAEKEEVDLSEEGVAKEREKRMRESGMDIDGDDFLQLDPNLNYRYQKGPYLVYDCADRHWVCTGRDEYLRCQQERSYAAKEGEEQMGCTTFRKYESLEKCVQAQQQITDRSIGTRFCLNSKIQESTFRY